MSGKLSFVWAYNYSKLREFIRQNNRLPRIEECDSILYNWIGELIVNYCSLPQYKKDLLDSINFNGLYQRKAPRIPWTAMYYRLKDFVTHNNRLPDSEEDPDDLKKWTIAQRTNKYNALKEDRKKLLNEIDGWYWELRYNVWDFKYDMLVKFIDQNKRIPVRKDDRNLSCWLSNQKKKYNNGKLSGDRLTKFHRLNIVIENIEASIWEEKYNRLRDFVSLYGRLPKTGDSHDELLEWTKQIKKEDLDDNQISKLEELQCWKWDMSSKKRKRQVVDLESSEEDVIHILSDLIVDSFDMDLS